MSCYRFADPGLDACAFEDDRSDVMDAAEFFHQQALDDEDRLREIFADKIAAGDFVDMVNRLDLTGLMAALAKRDEKARDAIVEQLQKVADTVGSELADKIERNW